MYGFKSNTKQRSRQAGFTLIEMLVSIALFAIVMVVCVGALLSLVGANKKAQALESVMNNLNISLDDMARSIREGTNFNGQQVYNGQSAGCITGPGAGKDCIGNSNGGTHTFSFAPFGTNTSGSFNYTYYIYAPNGSFNCVTSSGTGGCIVRAEYSSTLGGYVVAPLTAPEVSITSMEFYVIGTVTGDTTQPRVIITIDGIAGGGSVKTQTTFHLQATAVQRALDL
jgi:prepilin-type N-terminal cleavage/methylation domain-containing protein